MQSSYPAIGPFLSKLCNEADEGRRAVEREYTMRHGRPPGRCCVLEFRDIGVTNLVFDSANALREYFSMLPPSGSPACRLFVLEDLRLDYVDILGTNLGVDPSSSFNK